MATRNQAFVLALDGRTGEPLRAVSRDEALEHDGTPKNQLRPRLGAVPYPPELVSDQDGDRIDDVLITFIAARDEMSPAARSVELLSGASGQTIWRYELPGEAFRLSSNESVPYELRWFHGSGGGYSSGGGGFTIRDRYFVREHPFLERSGPHHYLPTRPIVLDGGMVDDARGGSPALVVTLLAGRRVVRLRLANGLPVGESGDGDEEVDWEIRPAIQPVIADLDGDGQVDWLALEPAANPLSAARQGPPEALLAAWSPAKRTWLWKRTMAVPLPRQTEMDVPWAAWPLVVDVDGDGAAEVLTPIEGSEASRFGGPSNR